MAARVIPFAQSLSAKNISITASDALPEGCMLQATQDAVTFTNNSGYPIDIAFNPPGIFTDITGLTPTPPNNFNTQSAPTNGAANYHVTVHNPGGPVVNGPYSIQAGTGFMSVVVSGSDTCTPPTVAIPIAGRLAMTPAVITDRYTLGWSTSDPFSGKLSVDSQPQHATGGVGEYNYEPTKVSIQGGAGGGGTIIVRGT